MRLGDDHRLMPSLPGWDGPPDPAEDGRIHRCPCGVEYATSAYFTAHDFEPCPREGGER